MTKLLFMGWSMACYQWGWWLNNWASRPRR